MELTMRMKALAGEKLQGWIKTPIKLVIAPGSVGETIGSCSQTARMESILELRGIVKRFPGVTALDSVDLSISEGEIHALVGQNGAGKSALIKVLCGAHPADEGEMRFQGVPFHPRTPLDALRAGIRVVHQEFNQLPYLSVAENLLFEKLPRRFGVLLDRATLERRAAELLNKVGLEIDPGARVERLGIAQRQLLEIAKALSSTGRLLVLDEPTATLTPREVARLFEIVRATRASGIAVILCLTSFPGDF